MDTYESMTLKPIVLPKKSWSWPDVRLKPIIENDEKLISLHYHPEKILVSPQYFIQNIEGSISECYARESVHTKLLEASKSLPPHYKFVVFDCWRPLKVQQSLFDLLKSEMAKKYPKESDAFIMSQTLTYVALPSKDPSRPSPHNTGGSIDLSIADENGALLNMGTDYDDSSEKSATDYYENLLLRGDVLSAEDEMILKNRRLLYHLMTRVGFTNYTDEYWHYDFGNQNWAWMTEAPVAFYGKTAPKFAWIKDLD